MYTVYILNSTWIVQVCALYSTWILPVCTVYSTWISQVRVLCIPREFHKCVYCVFHVTFTSVYCIFHVNFTSILIIFAVFWLQWSFISLYIVYRVIIPEQWNIISKDCVPQYFNCKGYAKFDTYNRQFVNTFNGTLIKNICTIKK